VHRRRGDDKSNKKRLCAASPDEGGAWFQYQ
jgi:hypothetical protein